MSKLETARLAALRAFEVLDTPADPAFDRLTAMAQDLFGTEMAVVSLIDERRQWFKSKQGLDGCQTDREVAFCDHAIRGEPHSVMVVLDATTDPRFRDNPSVTGEPFIRFYAGAVLTTAEGLALGTLCVFDSRPREGFDATERRRLRRLADLVMAALEQHRGARRSLRQSARREGRLRLLTDHMGDVVTRMRLDGSSDYISPAIERLLGYRPEEMAGRPAQAFVHPEDRAGVMAAMSALAVGRPRQTLQHRAVHRSGAAIWVETSFELVRDETGADPRPWVVAVIRDISRRKALEDHLAESEARYRTLADTAPDMITETRIDSTLTYISPASTAITGFTPQELLGRSALALMSFEDARRMQATLRQVLESGAAAPASPIQFRTLRKDGQAIWLESRPAVCRDPKTGRAVGFIDVIRDITQRKALEAGLEAARAEAEAAAGVKAEFLANMSHELRTPLTAVLGFSRLVAEQPELSETTLGYVRRLGTAGRALLSTVNDILDFSKLEAGQVEIVRVPAVPAEVIGESVALFEAAALDKGIVVTAEGLDELPSSLSLDPDRVRQLLLNLVGNAVKFTETGGVTVRAAWRDGWLTCGVVDTGAGIPAERAGRLFQRFSQVDASSTRRHGGTGLGLAICKGLVEAMGGEIGVESRVGEGSRFWFALPARRVAARTAPETGIPPGTRILLADDNPMNRELVRAILSACEVELTEAADGLEAAQAAMAAPFDLILMDLRMPRLDGEAAARRIRSQAGPNAGIPIAGFSADLGGVTPGVFDALVGKPIDAGQLLATLAGLLNDDPAREAGHEAA